jgi:hypothetical protein
MLCAKWIKEEQQWKNKLIQESIAVPWKRVVVRGRKRDELSHILRKE